MSTRATRIALTMTATAALLSAPLFADGDFLLSDNLENGKPSAAFPAGQPRLRTGADLTIVTDGEFASSAEFIKTASRPDGRNRALLDGNIGPAAAAMGWGSWNSAPYWATVVIDLKRTFLITRAALWPVFDDMRGMESCEVLLSNDNRKFISMGAVRPGDLKSPVKFQGVKVEMTLQKPATARYVMLKARKKMGLRQMIIAEAAVYGSEPPAGSGAALLPENQRPTVAFTPTLIQSGAVSLDWQDFAAGTGNVKCWKIYEADRPFTKITDPGVKLRRNANAKTTRQVLYPLNPGQTYYFGVTAEYEDGEYPWVKTAVCVMPRPFDCAEFGDMLAVNHFWGGGGARQKGRPHQREWEQVALDLLGQTPFRETRWWRATPEIVAKFYEHNLGMLPFPSENNFKNGLKMGLYAYSAGNEPELSGKPASVYLERLKQNYELGKKLNPLLAISAPTCNINNHALEWLDGFYRLGGKRYFDVLDLHTYFGAVADFRPPAGYPSGSPEALFERMDKVRAIMKKYGDEDKPVISTEFGYTDCNIGNPVGHMTPERKAQFLVRGLIIHYVLGFRRVFVYSFWDEGNDPNYTEHAFGMVDYDMQKKPAFAAVRTLGRELAHCTLAGNMAGTKAPHFGYVFKDRKAGDCVSVIWDGSGRYSGTFKTAPGKVRLIGLSGSSDTLRTAPDGRFRAVFGPAPVYLRSTAPVTLEKSVKVTDAPETAAGKVTVAAAQPVFTILPGGREVGLRCLLTNHAAEKYAVTVSLEDSREQTVATRKLEIAPGRGADAEFRLAAPAAALERYRFVIGYEDRYAGHSAAAPFFVRRLQPNTGKIASGRITMAGYDRPVWFVSSDRLEVTVDPHRGGRILEIIDKTTGANQLCLDYERLGSLDSIAFRYGIWDRVKSEHGFGIGRDDRYELKAVPGGVVMTSGKPQTLQIAKTLTLTGQAELKLKVELVNRAARELPASYYLHPEYTVGGTGDNTADVLRFPVGGETVELPFWNGLGDRRLGQLDAGWWSVRDLNAGLELKQTFSLKEFRQPRLWFGIGCYNIEMESVKDLRLAPGASWTGELKWQLFHQINRKQ